MVWIEKVRHNEQVCGRGQCGLEKGGGEGCVE